MSKQRKTRVVELYRCSYGSEREGGLRFNKANYCKFCWNSFRRFCPTLGKGMRPSQTRKLKMTYLKNGFKLERLK